MQVSGAVTAIGSIFEIPSAQRGRRVASPGARGFGDTVSISEEAAAYRNSLKKAEAGTSLDTQSEAQLTIWFDQWHSGAQFSVKSAGEEGGRRAGALLPEHAALQASLEKEIDRHLYEADHKPGEPVSAELLDKLRPLQQKLNVISSLGSRTVLDEETLVTAAKFLQALEDAWNEGKGGGDSLNGRFLAAISSWKTQTQDGYACRKKCAPCRMTSSRSHTSTRPMRPCSSPGSLARIPAMASLPETMIVVLAPLHANRRKRPPHNPAAE